MRVELHAYDEAGPRLAVLELPEAIAMGVQREDLLSVPQGDGNEAGVYRVLSRWLYVGDLSLLLGVAKVR